MRLGIALAIPMIAALTVAGTYLGKEVILCAGWVAIGLVGFLFINPIAGVTVMTSGFLLAAYPTLLDALGSLTINNLLGVGFVVILAFHVVETRDLSFLKVRYVYMYAVIGGLFITANWHAQSIFPLLTTTRGKALILDRTADMSHDFIARMVFLVFFCAFVRGRRDVRLMFHVFFLSLFLAVPSALVNWWQGNLVHGFRAAASVTSGANPNRLAMICLIEIACWWFWAISKPGWVRRVIAYGCIAGSFLVIMATGSRSGLLGIFVMAGALQTSGRRFRVPMWQVALAGIVGAFAILTVVPWESVTRMVDFAGDPHSGAASSNKLRADTIFVALHMIRDHPVLGVGLGNFREVSRQIYRDPFFRPPHNSPLWAATEGGLLTLSAYGVQFLMLWLDLMVVRRLAYRDPQLVFIAAALRVVFVTYMFFSLFADLFLNPITYILMGQVFCLRRYVESLPDPAVALPSRPPPVRLAAA
jgi:O-antigen ligase